ncbi:MAG: hypothetical protein ACFE75_10765 [Candidatus Hodarchaeota archaeon]
MGAGKIFCILGGIVTLLATYLFSFAGSFYGIGFIMNIPTAFLSDVLTIVMAVVFIIFLLAGLFIILGVKSRALAIIGSLFAIVIGIYFVLTFFAVLPVEIGQFADLFDYPPLVANIIPLDVMIGSVGLGTYLLLGGGVLGLIGGIMGTD